MPNLKDAIAQWAADPDAGHFLPPSFDDALAEGVATAVAATSYNPWIEADGPPEEGRPHEFTPLTVEEIRERERDDARRGAWSLPPRRLNEFIFANPLVPGSMTDRVLENRTAIGVEIDRVNEPLRGHSMMGALRDNYNRVMRGLNRPTFSEHRDSQGNLRMPRVVVDDIDYPAMNPVSYEASAVITPEGIDDLRANLRGSDENRVAGNGTAEITRMPCGCMRAECERCGPWLRGYEMTAYARQDVLDSQPAHHRSSAGCACGFISMFTGDMDTHIAAGNETIDGSGASE